MHITFNTVARALLRNEWNAKSVVDLARTRIDKEHVVHVRVCHPADIAVSILEVKRHDNAVLLIQALTHGILRHADKLYFWNNCKIRRIDACRIGQDQCTHYHAGK